MGQVVPDELQINQFVDLLEAQVVLFYDGLDLMGHLVCVDPIFLLNEFREEVLNALNNQRVPQVNRNAVVEQHLTLLFL